MGIRLVVTLFQVNLVIQLGAINKTGRISISQHKPWCGYHIAGDNPCVFFNRSSNFRDHGAFERVLMESFEEVSNFFHLLRKFSWHFGLLEHKELKNLAFYSSSKHWKFKKFGMQSLRIANFRPLGFPWIFARFPFPLEGTDLGQFAKKNRSC